VAGGVEVGWLMARPRWLLRCPACRYEYQPHPFVESEALVRCPACGSRSWRFINLGVGEPVRSCEHYELSWYHRDFAGRGILDEERLVDSPR
jgi:hypothetical protein